MYENSQVPKPESAETAASAQRRLVRGAFAAPAALTLMSGSAFAATSLSCVARQLTNPVQPTPDPAMTANGGGDNYIRVQLQQKFTGAPSPATQSTWVSGADLLLAPVPPAVASGSFLGTNNWWCYTAGASSGYSAGRMYSDADAKDIARGGTPTLMPNQYVAVRFDVTGKIVSVTSAANTSAVSHSCWSSFAKVP